MKKLEDGTLQFSIFPTIIHVLDFFDLVDDVEKICNGVEWTKLGGEIVCRFADFRIASRNKRKIYQ